MKDEGAKPGTSVIPAYEVGYARPPAQHRFQKGRSGNPQGRPRGARNRPAKPRYGDRLAEDLLLSEAYRQVTIREGEQIIELPAIQAVFRAMGVAALKGNRFVQKQLAEMVTKLEEQQHLSRMELFGKSLDYKIAWEREIERCRGAGLPEPAPIPHPDDMILNPDNGEVKIQGPKTREQKATLDEALVRRTEAQEDVTYFASKYRRARDPQMRARWLEEWHFEQRMFDLINEVVAPRYKAKLEDRSFAEGASREGQALGEIRKDLALRREYIEGN